MTASPLFRSFSFRFVAVSSLAVAAFALAAFPLRADAESPMPHSTHTTMVVFSDRPMNDGQWTALVSQLDRTRAEVAALVPMIGSDIDLDIERGDRLQPGLAVQKGISIFLKGDCTLKPGPRREVYGALGWVKEIRGKIQPFVYVECQRIVEMLAPIALGMNADRRNTVMAEAITRVIAHEWVHIASQDATHEESGVMQSQFQVRDLLANDSSVYPRRQVAHDRKKTSGF